MDFSNFATGYVVALPYLAAIAAMILVGRSSDKRNERIWHVALAWLVAAFGFAAASLSLPLRDAMMPATKWHHLRRPDRHRALSLRVSARIDLDFCR